MRWHPKSRLRGSESRQTTEPRKVSAHVSLALQLYSSVEGSQNWVVREVVFSVPSLILPHQNCSHAESGQ